MNKLTYMLTCGEARGPGSGNMDQLTGWGGLDACMSSAGKDGIQEHVMTAFSASGQLWQLLPRIVRKA